MLGRCWGRGRRWVLMRLRRRRRLGAAAVFAFGQRGFLLRLIAKADQRHWLRLVVRVDQKHWLRAGWVGRRRALGRCLLLLPCRRGSVVRLVGRVGQRLIVTSYQMDSSVVE